MNAKNNMHLAVGYARRSTDMQERSIPDQQTYVERWAGEHGYRIARWYIDDAISGTSVKGREQFEQMIRDAEKGADFKTILCYDISRFSRGGTNETGYYLHRLKMAGVEAIFVAEGIPEGDEGELLQGVKSWQARQYSVKLSRDSIRGTISYILDKKSAPGGRPPYGYDKQHCTAAGQVLRTFRWLPDGRKQELSPEGKQIRILAMDETVKKAKSDIVRFVPSTPDRTAVVRRIFDQCVAGYGYNYIASQLNKEGIPSGDGGTWNLTQINRILDNPTYRGAIAWNRTTYGKLNGVGRDGKLRPKTIGGKVRTNPEEDWFLAENVHEPLISPDMFRKAQAAIAKRRHAGGLARPINRSLLSGLLICTRCGRRYQQKYQTARNGHRPRIYLDGGYHHSGRAVCLPAAIPADALDAWVVGKVRDLLMGDQGGVSQAIDAFVKQVMVKRKKPVDTTGTERELEAVNRRITATISMLADPAYEGLDELRTTLADLKTKRDGLQASLALMQPAQDSINEPQLRQWASNRFRDLARICQRPSGDLQTRNIIHACVDRIEIDPENKRGVMYLPADAYAYFMRETFPRMTSGEGLEEGKHFP